MVDGYCVVVGTNVVLGVEVGASAKNAADYHSDEGQDEEVPQPINYVKGHGVNGGVAHRLFSLQGGGGLNDLGDDDGDVVSAAASMGVCCEQIDDVVEVGGVEVLADRIVVNQTA